MTPPLVKLSTELDELGLPQQADKFVKMARAAVKEGLIDAAYTGQRFDLPKQYRFKKKADSVSKKKRATDEEQEVYTRRTPEMVILKDEKYMRWFQETKQKLFLIQYPSMRREQDGRPSGTPSAEAIMADPSRALFWECVNVTRDRIAQQENHGRKLATGKGFHARSAPETPSETGGEQTKKRPKRQTDATTPAKPRPRQGKKNSSSPTDAASQGDSA